MDISTGNAVIRGLHSLEGHTAIQSGGGAHPWQDLRRSASDAQSSPKHVAARARRTAESICYKGHCIQQQSRS